MSVPPGAYDGQVIRLPNPGDPSSAASSPGLLILTLVVQPAEQARSAPDAERAQQTMLTSTPVSEPSPPPTVRGSDPNLLPTIAPPPPPARPAFPAPSPARSPTPVDSDPNLLPTVRASDPNLPPVIAPPPPRPAPPAPSPAQSPTPVSSDPHLPSTVRGSYPSLSPTIAPPVPPPTRSRGSGLPSIFTEVGNALGKFFSRRGSKKRQEAELSLFAIARTTLEADDRAIVGKVYTVQSGVSQHRPADFRGEPFRVSVQNPAEALLFGILLHPSENIELMGARYQPLRYDPRNMEPQFISCPFRLRAPGRGYLVINFYRERQWLKTIRFEFEGIEQSVLSTAMRGE